MRKKDRELIEKFQIEEEKRKYMPQEVHNKINKEIIENLFFIIFVMFFFLLLIFGHKNIAENVYQKDLKVFSILFASTAILLWEYSYKKENFKICLHGIEIAVLGIIVLFCTYVSILQKEQYAYYLALCSYFSRNILYYKKYIDL